MTDITLYWDIISQPARAVKTLIDIGLPRSAIIGAVVRGKKAFIPHGNSEIAAGDRVIAVALPEAIKSLEALFS